MPNTNPATDTSSNPEAARRNALAVETLREITNDQAPEASDFGAVAKVLNANRFAPPSGKRWTAKLVKAAFDAYIAATETK